MGDEFYFVALICGRTAVTVIDLAYCVDYERDEWRVIDDTNFGDPEDAIRHARWFAKVTGLRYVPFESRYNSSLNEPLWRI